jgi:5'-oxoaverantin cyclase/versicolorin B synthase
MRKSTLYAALTGTASIGVLSAAQQQSLGSVFGSIPGVASFFGSNDQDTQAAQLDGRIQGKDLLSSHFGPYGWPGQSFDYVIVGGGTAGLAVAKRLAEDGTHSVAVIEAGGFYEIEAGNATEVPMYLFNYFFDNGHVKNPLFDWYQYTVPQPVCIPRNEMQCFFMVADKRRVWHSEPCFTCKGKHWVAAQPEVPCCTIGKPDSGKPSDTMLTEHPQRLQGGVPEVGRSGRGRRLHLGQVATVLQEERQILRPCNEPEASECHCHH